MCDGVALVATRRRSGANVTVPRRPHGSPAASNTDASRYVVVVLPFVPVTPTTVSCSLGWLEDDRREFGEREPRVGRAKPRHGGAGGARRLGDDRDRAALDGIRGERRAVGALAANGDEDRARATRRANRA